jgi:hypothetical protein
VAAQAAFVTRFSGSPAMHNTVHLGGLGRSAAPIAHPNEGSRTRGACFSIARGRRFFGLVSRQLSGASAGVDGEN